MSNNNKDKLPKYFELVQHPMMDEERMRPPWCFTAEFHDDGANQIVGKASLQ